MTETKPQRETWGKWSEFFFSILGYVVGLSNIWRFPYLCYINGGGAFLIPFFIFMIFAAMPILLYESAVAQFANLGPGKVWVVCPLFKGVGTAMVIANSLIAIYYNVIVAWVLYYLYSSMYPTLAWSTCDNTWNTHLCYDSISLMKNSRVNSTLDTMLNSTLDVNVSSSLALKSSVEEYWERHVLNLSPSVNNVGTVRPHLLLCLFLIWLITFFCLSKGIKTSGKVVYVAATLPYVFLTILLIKGLALPGSMDGIYYFVKPNWEKVKDISVWKDAASQILFSIGVGTGGLATLASYSDFHNNCQRDAIIFPIIDALTSILSGLTSFSILGYMAHLRKTDLDNVISKGPGIAFIVYPEALSTLPFAQIWAVMFFAMLVFVGLDSQFAHVQVMVTAITDAFPEKFGNRQTFITGIVCLLSFIFGITCVTEGLWVLSIISFKHLTYGDGSMFPKWTNYTGWGIALFTILPVPILGTVEIMKHKGSFLNRLKQSVEPTIEWCPAKSRVDLKISISKPEDEVDSHLL
ncbi:sodiumchloride2-likedependent and chloride-dependent glycine transporter 2-like [Octopus vulgaris]|uniref:Transporter n=1 Tax=Octopus vulgaris TaxID=6645 RepID=A0AA36AYJ6_OCTVU|nr:sodiumchloride2-likedependent and chloride-dependent glycine transporter 2-like [Octopus vulgaris]